jgi:beta-glucosidase
MELYRNPSHSPSDRAKDLLGRMTIDEKVAQIRSVWSHLLLDAGQRFSLEKAGTLLQAGIGQISRPLGDTSLQSVEAARFVNDLQEFLLHKTRLGIPALLHEECLAGFQAIGATIFPQIIGVASTFDPALVAQMSGVLREQMRSFRIHEGLAPVLDVARDPRWGRLEETYGEEPYLIAAMGKAYVEGLRGPDIRQGILATVKHFAGYGASEGGQNWAPAHIPQRELRETYCFPFEVAIRRAGALAIMNGYHEIDGVPCGASEDLLTALLREQWGFEGIVVSDYSSIQMLSEYHRLAPTGEEAGLIALSAGMDMELPHVECFNDQFKNLFLDGKASMALLDRAVERILRIKFMMGLFEERPVQTDREEDFREKSIHRTLARTIAAKSIVLLKNENDILPIRKDLHAIAVIGPNADSWRNQLGDYSYPAASELIKILNEGMSPEAVASLPNPTVPVVTLLEGIRNRIAPGTRVLYAHGCGNRDASDAGFAEAEAIARQADVAVLVLGGKSGFTADCTSGEGRDRSDLSLPGIQHQLIRRIHATGTPVILVLVDGRPVAIPWEKENIPAILEAWLPGEEGGNAVADILFGDASPGGRLPVTFPLSVGQIPITSSRRRPVTYAHLYGEYVDGAGEPLYPFGHGLSYTSFAYSDLTISPAEVPTDGTVTVSCRVRNSGPREGDEVVQLYVQDLLASVTRPGMELKGFARIPLRPGESRTVRFRIPMEILALYDRCMRLVVEPGSFRVMIGSSSRDIRAEGEFTVTGKTQVITERSEYLSLLE